MLDFEATRGDLGGTGTASDEMRVGISSGASAVVASDGDLGVAPQDSVLPQEEQKRAKGWTSVPQWLQRAMAQMPHSRVHSGSLRDCDGNENGRSLNSESGHSELPERAMPREA